MSVNRLKLFVANLPWTVSGTELGQYFAQFGPVRSANVVFDKTTGFSKNFGHVTFRSQEAVENVFSKSTHNLEGNVLHVQVSKRSLRSLEGKSLPNNARDGDKQTKSSVLEIKEDSINK